MNRYKVFGCISVVLIVTILSFAFARDGRSQRTVFDQSGAADLELCDTSIEGIKFCTSRSKISVKAGQSIVLDFSLSNSNDREVWINRDQDTSYNFVVTRGGDEGLPTKREQKLKNPAISDLEKLEIISSGWISRRPEDTKLINNLEEKIVVSDIFDFFTVGIYTVTVSRTTRNPNGEGFVKLRLENIRIEVN